MPLSAKVIQDGNGSICIALLQSESMFQQHMACCWRGCGISARELLPAVWQVPRARRVFERFEDEVTKQCASSTRQSVGQTETQNNANNSTKSHHIVKSTTFC